MMGATLLRHNGFGPVAAAVEKRKVDAWKVDA